MKRYGAYHRVSQAAGRDVEDDNTITADEAWSKIDGWASAADVEIVERYLDWDKTGSKLERKDLERMLRDLDAGVIDGIVVAKTDRLSRAKVSHALKLIGEIQERHPNCLALLDLGVDPTTPTGELMLTLLLAIAHMQWRQFKESWAASQKWAVARGVWIGPVPFGYRPTVIYDKKGKELRGKLAVYEPEAEIVRKAFKAASADGLYPAMAHLERAVPGRRWRTSEVRRMLNNRAYVGEIVYGDHVNREAHTALVTEQVWNSAQTIPRSKRSNSEYPISNLVFCGECGNGMVGQLHTMRGKSYRRYRCGTCAKCSISADKLEMQLREILSMVMIDEEFLDHHLPNRAALTEAESQWQLAKDRSRRFAADTTAREILGDRRWYEALSAHVSDEESAEAAYRTLAGQEARSESLPAPDELTDPAMLQRALRYAAESGVEWQVQYGRGPVQERVVRKRPAKPPKLTHNPIG